MIGAGGVGQFVVQGARIAGAEAIVVRRPGRGAARAGARGSARRTPSPRTSSKDADGAIAPDGADYAFDAVGDPATTATALRFTRSGGHGRDRRPAGRPGLRLDLDPAEFIRREKFLTGTMYGSEDPAVALPILLEHVRAGRLDLRELLGPSFPLDEVNEAFEASLAGSPGRVLVAL